MSLKSICHKLNGIGSISKHCLHGSKSPDVTSIEPIQQGQWANLPPELLFDIIRRVEESETFWPDRAVVVACASVCKSWRSITKEIVKTPQQCGWITFPISLKQPGPRDYPIQCFIKRDKGTSTFLLYLSFVPSEIARYKLLLSAKKISRATSTEFIISLAADDFSRTSNKYIGRMKSNFRGTKFNIYENQPPQDGAVQPNCLPRRALACSHLVSTISCEHQSSRPRSLHCIMNSIPISSIQEGENAPTPDSYSSSLSELPGLSQGSIEPLILKNKAPIWDEQRKGWYLNFKGRVIVASAKNFQLLADVDPFHNVSPAEQERVILQFAKIGKDLFTMDYSYPLSAFQAFAICLTNFDN